MLTPVSIAFWIVEKTRSRTLFLDETPALQGWFYAAGDMARARDELVNRIRRVNPNWLNEPKGPLAVQWRADGPAPACYLTDLARCLYFIELHGDQNSQRVLDEKLGQLLLASDVDQFDETLTEIRFADFLVGRVRPISLEPLSVSEEDSRRRSSPDFGVRLWREEVLFEVTVVHVGFFEAFDRAAREIARRLLDVMQKAGVNRRLELDLPVGPPAPDPDALTSRALRRRIIASEVGREFVEIPSGRAVVEWMPMPFVREPSLATDRGPFVMGEPEDVVSISNVNWSPILSNPVTSENIVQSLRNSIDRKRTQLTDSGRYAVLVLRLGDHRINYHSVDALIHRRIWPNPSYKWLPGIVLFQPRIEFESRSPGPHAELNLNPNVSHPGSQDLHRVFSGETYFGAS